METVEQKTTLEIAERLEKWATQFGMHPSGSVPSAAKELRRLHAKVQELEAMLESIDAGGASAQRVTQGQKLGAAPHLATKSEERKSQEAAIAGALFDFAGYLTTRPAEHSFTVGAVHNATPMVESLKAWAKKRGLSLDDANVEGWDLIDIERKPLTDEQIEAILKNSQTAEQYKDGWYLLPYSFVRGIKRAIIGDTNGN